jgi:hypothetical protein
VPPFRVRSGANIAGAQLLRDPASWINCHCSGAEVGEGAGQVVAEVVEAYSQL